MKYRVILQDGAILAIEKHARYIAEQQQAPLGALRWLEKILILGQHLGAFPAPLPACSRGRQPRIRDPYVGCSELPDSLPC